MDTGAREFRGPWNFAQDPSGHLWIAFRYTGSEVLVGRYDPHNEQFALINAALGAEGEVKNHGTRHVRVDERGWVWLARRGVVVYDGQAWTPFAPPDGGERGVSASSSDIAFSDTLGRGMYAS